MSATKNFYQEQISSHNDHLDDEYHYSKWQEEMCNDPEYLRQLEERAEQEFYMRHLYANANINHP
jgi:hypothetical protein